DNIPEPPVPSILRGFSAPVKLNAEISDGDLAFLMAHDSDGFNRWEAGQRYALRVLLDDANTDDFIAAYGELLNGYNETTDKAMLARALTPPDISTLIQHIPSDADPAVL